MGKIVIMIYFLGTIICPTMQLFLGHYIYKYSPIVTSISNRAVKCLMKEKIIDEKKQNDFETCAQEKLLKNSILDGDEQDESETVSGEEASSTSSSLNSNRYTASEQSTLPGVVIQNMESGAILYYNNHPQYNYYGGTPAHENEKNADSHLKNIIFEAVALCSNVAGYNIDPSDLESVVKVWQATTACSKDAYQWAKNLLKRVSSRNNTSTQMPSS